MTVIRAMIRGEWDCETCVEGKKYGECGYFADTPCARWTPKDTHETK